jgi:hypothetical protein
MLYFNLEQAESIKNTYSSWVGRKAHIGNGYTSVLTDIQIKQKREFRAFRTSERLYSIQFYFEGGQKFHADDFFLHNGLMMTKLYSNK